MSSQWMEMMCICIVSDDTTLFILKSFHPSIEMPGKQFIFLKFILRFKINKGLEQV